MTMHSVTNRPLTAVSQALLLVPEQMCRTLRYQVQFVSVWGEKKLPFAGLN